MLDADCGCADKFHTLDYHFMRMGIQMIAIWGEDIIESDIHNGNGDDEYHFTEVMTKRTGRRMFPRSFEIDGWVTNNL